jgi:predicted phosphodiesterase
MGRSRLTQLIQACGKKRMRVFALSDIHADYPENRGCVAALPDTSFSGDTLILAGDISHDLSMLRKTLEIFLRKFRHVFFVPGNHELWIYRNDYENSLHKFHGVLRLCESLGVQTAPRHVGVGSDRVWIVPLFSWYTRPEEGPDSLFRPKPLEDPTLSLWADNYRVKWPLLEGFTPTELFLRMNLDRLSRMDDAPVISFSHFLPRQELIYRTPEEESQTRFNTDEPSFNFSRVAGSALLEKQIRQLGSQVHVYGHQHRNRFRHYDGIWYVSNCLGYGHERDQRRVIHPPRILKRVWPLEESSLPAGMVKKDN